MRRQDWPRRLAETIQAARKRPFSYGRHDCCQFVADAIEAMTDMRPGFCGYRSAAGARRMVKRCGLAAMVADIAAGWGYQEIPPAFAQRGDVMLIAGERDGFDATVGIKVDGGIAVAAPAGLTIEPWRRAARAWRVS